jgi:beta-galactosidase
MTTFYFGADYYPEHWPEERWPVDVDLMVEAGFNIVRLAEFAWSKMEPEEGQYNFDWLDRAMKLLSDKGIKILLGTPTASPPPWLMKKFPEFFLVSQNGIRATYGNRREYCPTNTKYREYSSQIARMMAEHYQDHPAVVGWQIDNELSNRCFCPICQEGFHKWLQEKYQSLDVVNKKWGTVFWGHEYSDWDQIPVPLHSGGAPNPSLALDYYRFQSDAYVDFQSEQIRVVREVCPDHLLMHNFMGFYYDQINYFDLAKEIDLVTLNTYQRTQFTPYDGKEHSALIGDTMRGLKNQNYWMTEQQGGPGGWDIVGVTPRPGEIRLWSFQSIAHGADAIIFFRWRTTVFGTEQYWHGILDHHGAPNRRYQEVKKLGNELQAVSKEITGTKVQASVGMLLSYDSRFAFQIQKNHPGFKYSQHFMDTYRELYNFQIPVDILSPDSDFSHHQLVILPSIHVVDIALAEKIANYVKNGGVILVTPRSGVKDEFNLVVDKPLPGKLADVCGIDVEEHVSLMFDFTNEVRFDGKGNWIYPVHTWCDILTPSTAEVIARYTQDYYASKPAITLNKFGKGKAIYVGTFGERKFYQHLIEWTLDEAGIKPKYNAPEGVEIRERWSDDQRILFILNHTQKEQQVQLDGKYRDLLADKPAIGKITIPPLDVVIFEG